MSALAVLILSLLAPQGHTGANPATSAADAVAPPCDSRVVVVSVWRDDPTPCDVMPGQRLDVFGVTLAACDDMGGEYIVTNPDDVTTPATNICEGVDY